MGPTQNDFVNQFEQQVSGPSSSKGGDIILTPDQTQKSKKPIIIAAVAVVFLLAVVAVVLLLKGGNLGNSGNSKEFNGLAKDYSMSVKYGLDYNGIDEEDRKELTEKGYYYLLDYEKVDNEYLESLEKKLLDLENAAANKTAIHTQLENIKYYRIAKLLLDGYTDYEYSVPENASDDLKSAYSTLGKYVTAKEAMEQGLLDYEDGLIFEEELADYEAEFSRVDTQLTKKCREIRENAVAYARSLYEEK